MADTTTAAVAQAEALAAAATPKAAGAAASKHEAPSSEATAEVAARHATADATAREVARTAATHTKRLKEAATPAAETTLSAATQGGGATAEANANQEATATATEEEVAVPTAAKQAMTKDLKAKDTPRATAEGESSRGAATILRRAQATALPQDLDDWELSEGGLPEGSTLSGRKALMDDYPEDEANSKQTKKKNTDKGQRSKPKPKA